MASAVSTQDEEPLGIVVIVLGRDSVSVGGIGETPSQEEVGYALASWSRCDSAPGVLH